MVCTYGASVAPGVDGDLLVWVDRSVWETVTGDEGSWLDEFLGLFIPYRIPVSDLCALNLADPAFPSLSDIRAAVARDPLGILIINNWVRDKLLYATFADNCVCNGAPGASCYASGTSTYTLVGNVAQDTAVSTIHAPGYSAFTVNWKGYNATNGLTYRIQVWAQRISDNVWVSQYTSPNLNPTNTPEVYGPWALTAGTYDFVKVAAIYNSATGTCKLDLSLTLDCPDAADTTPTAPVEPTQPTTLPAPTSWMCTDVGDLCLRLQQLDQKIDWLRRDVTLIQRQAVPFAYVAGDTHTGLTGSGTIVVQGILGVSVAASVPGSWGSTSDDPPRYIPKYGSIQVGTAIGLEDEQQLHYDDQLVMGVSGGYTIVNYSLRPGVTASITEILREP